MAGEHNEERIANQQVNTQRYNDLERLIGVQESRIQNLQNSAFQLANYYFVFQGVVLAAVSNTKSLTCSDSWLIFILSLLAASLNLFALFAIMSKYVRTMDLHEQTWSEFNEAARRLNRDAHQSLEFTGEFSPANNNNNNFNREWRDHFSQRRRYMVVRVCMALFLAFAAVTLSSPWVVMCNHDKHRKQKQPYGDHEDCLKLCDGSRCLFFCRDN